MAPVVSKLSDHILPYLKQLLQVNIQSLSEEAGLSAGDLLVAVNGHDVTSCRHKEAQDTIVSAGNNLTITVQR